VHRKILQGLLIGLAAAAVAGALYFSGGLARLEAVTWDWRVGVMRAPGAASDDIKLILLDQASLDWAEETMGFGWPWPREVYGAILGFCKAGGARAVAFDVLFSEVSEYRDQDESLGAAIAAGVPFAGAVFFEDGKATFPIDEVATNATTLGSIIGDADTDGTIRRIRPILEHDGQSYWTLGLAAYRAASPDSMPAIPVDRNGRAILRWRGTIPTNQAISAAAAVQSFLRLQSGESPVVQPSVVSNKYVLFGFTAPGLMDLRSTPVNPVFPGVAIHATLLDNFLSGDFMRELPRGVALLWLMVLGLVAGVAGRHSAKVWQIVVGFAVLLPLPLLLALAAYHAGWWVPVVAPAVAAGLGLIGSVVVNYALEGRQKRFIKGAFKQYLSPVVIDRLLANPTSLKLGGELRELSIFFSDVQGFTGISEHLGPEALTSLLNKYLTAMTNIIMEEGGTIDKYEGDAIIAFWNAPVDLPDHPLRAVRAALRCQAALDEMRPRLLEEYGKEIWARIGINTGPVVVGNMGSDQRFDYTFLGDAGNLAARLEGINKQFGTFILISEHTVAHLDDSLRWREISRVQVVGRKEAVRVFEPLPAASDAAHQVAFATALQSYYDGAFEVAAGQFDALAATDATATIYAARCRRLAATPPDAWDGVWSMTEK